MVVDILNRIDEQQLLVLERPSTQKRGGQRGDGAARTGYNLGNGCCARRALSAARDFRDQKGHLQEAIKALD